MAREEKDKSNEILGLIFLLIGVFLAVAYFVPSINAGPLGTLLLNMGRGFIGATAYVFPFLFFFLSAAMFLQTWVRKRRIRIYHILLLLILLSAFLHSITISLDTIINLSIDSQNEQTVFQAFSTLAKASVNPQDYASIERAIPGGMLGGIVAMGLQRITGEFGASAILLTALLAEALVLFNFSIERILSGVLSVLIGIASFFHSMISSAVEAMYQLSESKSDTKKESLKRVNSNSNTEKKSSVKKENKKEVISNREEPAIDYTFPSSYRNEDFQMPDAISKDEKEDAFDFEIHGLPSEDSFEQKAYTDREDKDFRVPDFHLEERDILNKSKESNTKNHKSLFEKNSIEKDFDFSLPDNEIDELPFDTDLDDSVQIEESKILEKSSSSRNLNNRQETLADGFDQMTEDELDNEGSEDTIPDLLEEAEEEKVYEFPPITLLEPRPVINSTSNAKRIKELASRLEATLESFGVVAKVVYITTGPSITRFELKPGPGVKISKIVNLSDDIALSLAATTVRIEAPIPGKSAVGIEIPNSETATVGLRSLIESDDYAKQKGRLVVPLGRDIPGQVIFCDLARMPHLLIAGATGSGKSVCINTILLSLLYRCSPKELKLLLIDPKVVELSVYNDIPHLLAPVVTDPKKAANTLNWAVEEMTNRYKAFAEYHVRDMKSYNDLAEREGRSKMPFVVLVIDELSDLMATSARDVEDSISRLTAMARAAGIHLIIATQRPSVDVITGVIKANIPSRIAFAVSSQVDSRTILDGSGAEKLLGKGDMLYSPQSASKATRGQGAFVEDKEVENVVSFLKAQKLRTYDKAVAEKIISTPAPGVDTGGSDAEPDEDELLNEAVEVTLDAGYASVSLIQRRLNVGHPRAGRLIDAMEMKGYVGPHEGSKPRKLLLTRSDWAIIQAQNANDESTEDDSTFDDYY